MTVTLNKLEYEKKMTLDRLFLSLGELRSENDFFFFLVR